VVINVESSEQVVQTGKVSCSLRKNPSEVHKVTSPQVQYAVLFDDGFEVRKGTSVTEFFTAGLKLSLSVPDNRT